MGAVLSRATLGAQASIRYVTPVPPSAATGAVAQVYTQLQRDFGLIAAPVSLHSPAPGPLAACWLMLRESLIAAGHADRAAKEAVAAAVSLANTCPYCVEVHAATLHGLARGRDAAAIAAGHLEAVTDPRLRTIVEWASAGADRVAAGQHEPPFPPRQAAELTGVAVAFHYLNRMVTIFLPESPLPPGLPAGARGGVLRMVGWLMRPIAGRRRAPGTALELLPAAALPADLTWASGDQRIADSFARAAAAIDAAGERSVPEPVRELVEAELVDWKGQPMGVSRSWAGELTAALPSALRPAGELALLTALSPHQVGQSTMDDFRAGGADDRTVVELTSWASMAAARQLGGWIRPAA